ncbi:MAG TPA: VOC family protein [Rhizobacter sp.]|nr:VOC family protein [Rhizobacter sp.]
MKSVLDHLVVGARTLAEGVAWCEATLGVTPEPGGQHPLMGTHNRLVDLSSPAFAQAYLEIIAIDPQAPPPGRIRWYDLDDDRMQAALAQGPRLIHWVARSADLRTQLAALAAAGWERGEALQAERGPLHWQISVRPDGQRLCDGALPTLITWGDQHACDHLPPSRLGLQALAIDGLPETVMDALHVEGVQHVPGKRGSGLRATLFTPRGVVALDSRHPAKD